MSLNFFQNQKKLVERWSIITKALQKDLKDLDSLSSAILSYNGRYSSKWKYDGLKCLLEEVS